MPFGEAIRERARESPLVNRLSVYAERLETAGEAERPQIVDEAKTALTKAVTDQGLSVEEYASILQVAENDTSVREKILQRLHPDGAD